jgi:hypothetical protein
MTTNETAMKVLSTSVPIFTNDFETAIERYEACFSLTASKEGNG